MPQTSSETTAGAGNVSAEEAERNFVECIDLIQDYTRLQIQLQDQLRQGLLNITKAKYSMGPIGQPQYDSEMMASIRIETTGFGGNGGESEPSCSSPACAGASGTGTSSTSGLKPVRFTIQKAVAARKDTAQAVNAVSRADTAQPDHGRGDSATAGTAATARANCGRTGPAAPGGDATRGQDLEDDIDLLGSTDDENEDEGLREANEFLRRMRLQMEGGDGRGDGADDCNGKGGHHGTGGSGGSGVGAEGEGSGGAGGRKSATGRRGSGSRGKAGLGSRRRDPASDPLHWFGVLVPPALKEAQVQFASVLETSIQLANLAQRIRVCAGRP